MKMLFVGDPHFDNQTPSSRIDDYAEASLNKLKSILKLSKEQSVSEVITTGDFFDKYTVSFSYLNELMIILNQFKEESINVWSLIGNHDLPYNNIAYFKNTPLNVLFGSGLVKHLKWHNDFGDFEIYGIDFTEEKIIDKFINETQNTKPKILVMHYATCNTIPGESIDINKLYNFDVVVSGHDHMYYTPELINKTALLRPGSLLRRTKDEYNLTRDVVVYLVSPVLQNDYKCVGFEWKEIKLPGTKLASEIFKNEVFTEQNLNLYDNKYNNLFNKDYFESEVNNILEILQILPVTVLPESKKTIKEYLKEHGI
jgi:DNA repair exonuclease SbcCD nuclease subunit